MSGAVLLEYRLRIRTADDTADALVVTSVQGGTNPYLAGPPQGDGASIDPLTMESLLGAYTVTIADASTGAMQRIVTAQLEDANQRQQLGYRKAFLEYQLNGGGFTHTLIAGVLTLLRLTDAATWEATVTDPMRAQLVTQMFSPASSMNIMDFIATWPNRGCALGGPIMTPAVAGKPGKVLGIEDLGGWQMRVDATAIAGQYILRPVNVYGPPIWKANEKIENVADPINQALAALQGSFGQSAQLPWTTIKDTAANYYEWAGLTVLIDDGTGAQPWKPIPYAYSIAVDSDGGAAVSSLLVSTRKGDAGLKVISDGTRTLTNGALVRVRVLTVLPSDISPIYLTANPIDLLTTLWTAAGISFDAAACTTLKQDPSVGENAYMAFRITAPQNLADLVAEICKPWGIGIRANAAGELQPFQARTLPNTPPTVTITGDDVVDGSTSLVFELDPAKAVQTITFTEAQLTDQRSAPLGTGNSVVDGVVASNDEITLLNGDASAIPFGTLDLSTQGMIHTAGAKYATVDALVTAIGQTIFNRFGHGAVALETTLLRGGAGDGLQIGDECLVDLPQLPNHNYRLGDNPAIAARAMQIVRFTELPTGYAVRLLDSGPNAQPLGTVPTLSIAATSDAPRTVAAITITNAAALNALGYGARLQWATTSDGSTPAATAYTDVQAWGANQIPTGAVRLSAVAAGTTIYVRARSEGVSTARPSNYGATAHLTLSAVADPSALAATPDPADGSRCALAWTPGAGTSADFVDVWLRATGAAFSTATKVVTLNPGSTGYTLEGLTPGAGYTASVQYRDPTTQDTSDPVDVAFTAGAAVVTVSMPTFPIGFAGTQDGYGMLQQDGTYGLAVDSTASAPCVVAFEEQVETAAGSGVYGAWTSVGSVAAVQHGWTIYASVAPNDGLRRRLRAQNTRDGATASLWTDDTTYGYAPIVVSPWTAATLTAWPAIAKTRVYVERSAFTPGGAPLGGSWTAWVRIFITPVGFATEVELANLQAAPFNFGNDASLPPGLASTLAVNATSTRTGVVTGTTLVAFGRDPAGPGFAFAWNSTPGDSWSLDVQYDGRLNAFGSLGGYAYTP